MAKRTISTSFAPEVIIERIQGGLSIQGWDEPEVIIEANPDDLRLEEQDDILRLSCQGGCDLRVPQGATIKVEQALASASFKSLEDLLEIEEVHGSISLRNVAAVQVKSVHGELAARHIAGDLRVGLVHGNANVREVQGACALEQVYGNADLRDIEADVQVEARGNIRLRLGTLAGASYQIQAEGNLNARIPEDVSLQLSLTSRAKNIKVRLPQGAQAIAAAEHELVLGDGAVEMRLVAGGNLYLVSEGGWEQGEPENFEMVGADFSNELSQQIAQQVETQIQAQIEAMTRQINAQVAQLTEQVGKAGLSPEETERLMEQARQTSERETARAEEKIRKAREKLELKLEAARRKQEVKAQAAQRRARVHRSWEFEPSTPKAKSEPVSEEERLMILSMLEQKKISLEEAEQLLASLEGREA